MEDSLNVDNLDKSLLSVSISLSMLLNGRFTLKQSLVKLSLQIFTLKFSFINLCIEKAGERVVPQKAIVFLLTVLHASCFSKWRINFNEPASTPRSNEPAISQVSDIYLTM